MPLDLEFAKFDFDKVLKEYLAHLDKEDSELNLESNSVTEPPTKKIRLLDNDTEEVEITFQRAGATYDTIADAIRLIEYFNHKDSPQESRHQVAKQAKLAKPITTLFLMRFHYREQAITGIEQLRQAFANTKIENIEKLLQDLQNSPRKMHEEADQESEKNSILENRQSTYYENTEFRALGSFNFEGLDEEKKENIKGYLRCYLGRFFPHGCHGIIAQLEKNLSDIKILQAYVVKQIVYKYLKNQKFEKINIIYDTYAKRIILYIIRKEIAFIAKEMEIKTCWQKTFTESFVKYHSNFEEKKALLKLIANDLKLSEWQPADRLEFASFINLLANRYTSNKQFLDNIAFHASTCNIILLREEDVQNYLAGQKLFFQFFYDKSDNRSSVIEHLRGLEKYMVFQFLELYCMKHAVSSDEKQNLFSELYTLYSEMEKPACTKESMRSSATFFAPAVRQSEEPGEQFTALSCNCPGTSS